MGYLLVEYRELLPPEVAAEVYNLAWISKWLRKEREFSFYGDLDFIPTEEYTVQDARRAMADAEHTVKLALQMINATA
ncbi:hypothetical protein [Desulfurispora thermophila]|uniref:hypothetical protein n=1 Tax=Desulfurispora thermophila TaxID=265470 RepID=UPI0003615962|nr:hypothetical protein [Desulfurispora thermophila]